MTVIEYVVASIYGENLATMARTIEEIALFACYNGSCKTIGQSPSLSITEYARQFSTSANKELVGVVVVPTRAYEHIPISIASV